MLLNGLDETGQDTLGPVEKERDTVEQKGFRSEFIYCCSLAVNVDDGFPQQNNCNAENKGGCLRKLNHELRVGTCVLGSFGSE